MEYKYFQNNYKIVYDDNDYMFDFYSIFWTQNLLYILYFEPL